MIYKVIDSSEALTKGATELNKYNIYFVKGCLFISDKNNTQNFYEDIKSVFAESEIYEINENNLKIYSLRIQFLRITFFVMRLI